MRDKLNGLIYQVNICLYATYLVVWVLSLNYLSPNRYIGFVTDGN